MFAPLIAPFVMLLTTSGLSDDHYPTVAAYCAHETATDGGTCQVLRTSVAVAVVRVTTGPASVRLLHRDAAGWRYVEEAGADFQNTAHHHRYRFESLSARTVAGKLIVEVRGHSSHADFRYDDDSHAALVPAGRTDVRLRCEAAVGQPLTCVASHARTK